ncbi:MAG: hypothetical protein ACF8PN_04960 [Phycisphaerales bacterium]
MGTEDNADTAEDSTAGDADTATGTAPTDTGAADTADAGDTGQDTDGATPDELQAEVDKWKAMARKHEKAAKAFEAAEAERAQAEMTELDKANARADEAAGEVLELRRRLVAAEQGLPPELGSRLQGSTEDELVEDAKRLAELMPTKAPTPSAAKAGIGTAAGEPAQDPMALHRQFTGGGPNPPPN